LGKKLKNKISNVISENMDAFAWTSADMPGINPDFDGILKELFLDVW